jgi:hypothetical protein
MGADSLAAFFFSMGAISRTLFELLLRRGQDEPLEGGPLALLSTLNLIIELKRGIKKGDPKPTDPRLQAKHWFAELLLSLLIQKSKGPATLLAMGLPKFETYQRLLNKTEHKKLGFTCFIVDQDGNIEIG